MTLSAKAQVKQAKKVEDIKLALKTLRPHFKVLRGGRCASRLVVRCKKCDKEYEQWATYFIDYDCQCTATHTKTLYERTKLLKRQMSKNIELVGEYKNASTKVKVRCKRHDITWEALPSNLRKGHECRKCGLEEREKTCLKVYGNKNPLCTSKVMRKVKRTMLKRYGVEHAHQNQEIHDKSIKTSARRKTYELGSRKITVQGYEPAALDYIQKVKGIRAKDIECGTGNRKIPKISYYFDGKERVYFPDIYLPKLNRLIEVKSEYTYRVCRSQNRKKKAAAKKAGYKFSFLLMNKNGTLYAVK